MKKSGNNTTPALTLKRPVRRGCGRVKAAALSLLVAACGESIGQEAVRMSLAGEAAAEARERAAAIPGYYNLRLGPTGWNFSAGLDVEANDNIRFDSSHPVADLTLSPQFTAHMAWQVSHQNSVNLSLGTGYSAYVLHPEFDRFFISPGSELSWDLYAGDFWINFHERISITQNAYQDPTVVGTADYSQLQNIAGLTATCDLNQLVLKLGYDHAGYTTLSGGDGAPDGSSDIANFSAAHRFAAQFLTGIESGGGVVHYQGASAGLTSALDWNAGAFVEAQPMQYVSVKAAAGYTVYAPTSGAQEASTDEFTGAYARLALNHRLNQFLEYALSGGRNVSFGFFGGTIDLYTAALSARWHLFRKLGLATWFEFEHGSQLLVGQERFDRFGPGVSLDRPITRHISGSLRYQFYQRSSNLPQGDYAVNILTLNLTVTL